MQSKYGLLKSTIFILIMLVLGLNLNGKLVAFNELIPEYTCSQENTIVIDSLLTTIDIKNNTEILVSEDVEIRNNQNNSISYIDFKLNQDYTDLIIEDRDGELEVEIEDLTGIINVTLRNDLLPNITEYLYFNYNLDLEIEQIEDDPPYYNFQFEKFFYYYTYLHRISVRLPVNCEIHDFEFLPNSYYPTYAILTKTGNRYYLDWEFENLEAMSTNLIFVFYEEEVDQKTPYYWFAVGPILGVIVGAGIVYWFMRRREKLSLSRMEMIYLTDNQKLLLKILYEKDKKMQQKELLELTGFTKSKISRNLTPLLDKGLIVKEKWGREYIVYITEDGKTVFK